MTIRQAVGAVVGAAGGVAFGVTLEAHVFDGWPWWATLAVAIGCCYIGFWGLHPKDPDRGKTYWEKRLSELEGLIEALRACEPRETLAPKHQIAIHRLARDLDGLGLEHPPTDRVPLARDPVLRRIWEIYLWIFTSKVRTKDAANLRPVWDEAREYARAEGQRIARHNRMIDQMLSAAEPIQATDDAPNTEGWEARKPDEKSGKIRVRCASST